MSNLPSIKDQFIISGYKFSEKEFNVIKASESTTLNNVNEKDLKTTLLASIMNAGRTAGQSKLTEDDLMFCAKGVYDFVRRGGVMVRYDEILLAIQIGSEGGYNDEVVFICVKNCIRWIKTYLAEKNKTMLLLQKAKEREGLLESEDKHETNLKEYAERLPERIQENFNHFKATNEMHENSERLCRELEIKGCDGFLSVSDEDKIELFKQVKPIVIEKARNEAHENKVKFVIELIKGEGLHEKIVNACKVELLKNHYIINLDSDKIEIK